MKKRKTRSLFVLEIVMLFLSILIIAPCLMMIFGSFKTALEANHFNIKPPSEWHFENYIEVFKKGKLLRALKNSVLMVLMTVPAVEILSAVSSFVLARRKGKVAEILYTVLSMGGTSSSADEGGNGASVYCHENLVEYFSSDRFC